MYRSLKHSLGKDKAKKLKHMRAREIQFILRKQVGVIAYPKYSASVAFLRVRRINIEIKKLKNSPHTQKSTVIAQSEHKAGASSLDAMANDSPSSVSRRDKFRTA